MEKTFLPQRLFITFGLLLAFLSSLLPWLNISSGLATITRSGFEFFPEASVFAVIFFFIGSLAVWFYNRSIRAGFFNLIMGIVLAVEGVAVYPQLQDRIALSTNTLLVSVSSGYYVFVIGAAMTIIGSILLIVAVTNEKEEPKPLTPVQKEEILI